MFIYSPTQEESRSDELSDKERYKILTEWNQTKADFSRDICLHHLVDAEAELYPDVVAAVFESQQITYGELIKRANQLAHYLKKLGVGPDTLVGLCVERSMEMLIGVLGIQKAGGAYVPLDPAFPSSRIELVLEDANAQVLVTAEKQVKMLDTTARLVCLDSDWPKITNEKTVAPDSGVQSNNLAYVIYTSGSTGRPKGVQIEHRTVVNFLNSMRKAPGFQKQDALLAVTTLSFDISVLELYLPLITGGRVVILPDDKTADGAALIRALDEAQITMMQATPASWRLMLESGWKGSPDLKVLCGGEPMPADLAKELIPRCKELWNMYGPTETTIWSTCFQVKDASNIHIGRPIDNTEIYILDEKLQPLPVGAEAELMIGGEGLARGYNNLPELTAEKFIPHPFNNSGGGRIYRTGDLARYLPDGSIECLGRLDDQIKLHGFRIELGEIETRLSEIEGIARAVVVMREDRPGHKRLVAYYLGSKTQASDILRQSLLVNLPEYMVPSLFIRVERFPLTPNGKLDRKALPSPQRMRPSLATDFIAPQSPMEKKLAACWCEVLDMEEVGIEDSFFDLGGTSLLAARMVTKWQHLDEQPIPLVKVFQYPTIALLCKWLSRKGSEGSITIESNVRADRLRSANKSGYAQIPVAIVGMAGRFPGAENLDALWNNICTGVESISVFDRDELGIGVEEWLRYDPDYVPARGIIDGAEFFDAAFFGIGSLEASVMDPQQRVFLELACEVLENAGYDPERFPGPVGVYAGVGDNHYYSINLLSNSDIIAQAGKLVVEYGNEKDYIALRVAYALGLTGPALSANTACSTSLVAVDNAVQGLANYDCDMALAGGVDICVPQKSGFLHEEGGAFTKDGHCKPFDAGATGTMFCDGAGLVALKRLDDALADGDTIYAVIRGSAKNNNGSRTGSFLAPSVEGQAEVIAMAQARAAIPVETIGYVEAHGTGTPLGDPIEVEALSKVFGERTDKKQFCYIGSIKGHIGHPTNAAGVAGLIKSALVLHKEMIPPTHHYKKPNPKIDFATSPFKVVDKLVPFPRNEMPRRAAVSSFGFGGTNVHAILEEAPLPAPTSPSRPLQLIAVSAKTESALASYGSRLAAYFADSDASLFPDAAYTLIQGRKHFPHRRFIVAGDPVEAAQILAKPNPLRSASRLCTHQNPPVVFLFGGQGTQYLEMGLALYKDEPLFRTVMDECFDLLKPHLDSDLHDILFPAASDRKQAREKLQNTRFAQPAIFTIQYAMARLWQSFGVQPAMMVGHSLGEFVAATLAGVFTLSDALRIVATRAKLMQSMPKGSMLSVRATADEIVSALPDSIQLAAVNAPSLCVVSGPTEKIMNLQKTLESKKIVSRILHTSHAFHSVMMEPILGPLKKVFESIKLNSPGMPFISTVTGRPITDSQACDVEYWVLHARKTVQFSSAIQWLVENGYQLFLECGPRATMCTLARQHMSPGNSVTAVPSMGDSNETLSEWEALLMAAGSLWLQGIIVDWSAFYASEKRRRIPLPTYPFERKRYWVDAIKGIGSDRGKTLPKQSGLLQEEIQSQDILMSASPAVDHAVETNSNRRKIIDDVLIKILATAAGGDSSMIGHTATFLEQGLDSLSLTQVAFGIRKELGVKVSFNQLMKAYPNIEMLSAHIDENLSDDFFKDMATPQEPAPVAQQFDENDESSTIYNKGLEKKIEELSLKISNLTDLVEKAGIPPVGQDERVLNRVFDSTIPQRGIYFSSRLSNRLSAAYNESVTVMIEGLVDAKKLCNVVNRLVQRHDALRASFDSSGEKTEIKTDVQIEIRQIDIAHLEGSSKKEALQKIVLEESGEPFSLPHGPLFRSTIIIHDVNAAAVVLTGHHTVCDGWSLDVLIKDFCAFYSEEVTGRKINLPSVTSYGDYVRMASARETEPDFKAARDFWHSKFASGFPALILPSDQPRSSHRKYAANRKEVRIDSTRTRELRLLAASRGWSFFGLILGVYAILLARVSRQHHFVISLPTAEQPVLGKPDLVGHCVQMLPFEVLIKKGDTVDTFLSGVQEQLAVIHEFAMYTATHLISELHPSKRMQGTMPITAGITSVKKFLDRELLQEGFEADYDINQKSFESFELYITALEIGDELILRGNYDIELFNDSTVDSWLKSFCEILLGVSGNSFRPVYELADFGSNSRHNAPEALFLLPEKSVVANDTAQLDKDSYSEKSKSRFQNLTNGALEFELVNIWRDLLKIKDIDPDDDFFGLGGTSMAAAQMFEVIERDLNIKLPLSILFESPTPRMLASKINGKNTDLNWNSLVPIRSEGDRRPLFLIHGAEGNVLIYRSLSRHLGDDQPVYGLQASGMDGGISEEVDLEKVAAQYIKEIRTVQSHGPYNLGGYCLGGTIALEMAQQLKALGETVGLVVMIENYNIKAIKWPLPTSIRLCNKALNVYYHIRNLFAARTGWWVFFNQKLKIEIMRARIAIQVAREKNKLQSGDKNDHLHHIKVGEAYDKALEHYDVKPYEGKVALFLANKNLFGFNVPKGGWSDIINDKLEIVVLPVKPRGTMYEPHVRQLAKRLRILLAQTD